MNVPSESASRPPVPFLDLRRQYVGIQEEIDQAMRDVMASTSFIGGPPVRAFEEAFAEYVEAAHVVGLANGTDAIEIGLEALDLGVGGEIIVPALSFVATSEAVTRAGFDVVFADVDPGTFTLTAETIRPQLTDRTVAVIAVHLYGQPAPVDEIEALCAPRGIAVVEDAAQAHGARIEDRTVGALGRFGTFSFYPGKNLGAYGDAGALATNDEALARKVRRIANHGRVAKYDHELEGRNSRLDGLQAAVLSVKLRHLDRWTDRRRALADCYRSALEGVGDLVLPAVRQNVRHVYHLFVVRSARRDGLREHLAAAGVSTGIHYPVALPRLRAYRDHPQHRVPFRAAELAGEVLSLPIGDSLEGEQLDRVCDEIRRFFV